MCSVACPYLSPACLHAARLVTGCVGLSASRACKGCEAKWELGPVLLPGNSDKEVPELNSNLRTFFAISCLCDFGKKFAWGEIPLFLHQALQLLFDGGLCLWTTERKTGRLVLCSRCLSKNGSNHPLRTSLSPDTA